MATKRYNVDKAIFDYDFGLSDGYSSDEEEGEDYYTYFGDPVVLPSDIEVLTHDVVSGDEDGDDRDNDSDDFLPEFDPFDGPFDKEDLLGLTGTCSDHGASMSGLHDNSDSFPGTVRVFDSHSSAESDSRMSIGGGEVGELELLFILVYPHAVIPCHLPTLFT